MYRKIKRCYKNHLFTTYVKRKFSLSDYEVSNILIGFDINYTELSNEDDNSVTFKCEDKTIIVKVLNESITINISSPSINHTIIFSRLSNIFTAYYNNKEYFGYQDLSGLKIFHNLEEIIAYTKDELIPFETDDQGLLIGFGKYMFTKFTDEWINIKKEEERRIII